MQDCKKIIENTQLAIYEFGYLIRAITRKNGLDIDLGSHHDFEAIANNYALIIKMIDEEIQSEKQIEYGVSKNTAQTNLKNLKMIVNAINDYQNCIKTTM